jgi:flagellar hook-length control protein FliK
MLTSALPTSTVNPVNSSFNGGSSASAGGHVEAAPDGFARLLDKASKPETAPSPDRPAPASGGSSGSSGSDVEDHGDPADASTVDVRTAPWPAGPKPIKSQHPPVKSPPGHLPVRLPPVPGDDAATDKTLDSLALAAGTADGSTDAGLLDAAAAALAAAASPPATPTPAPDSASTTALLAAWQASAAAAAPGGAASDSADRAIDALDSATASGGAATLAGTATRRGLARADVQGELPGDAQGELRGDGRAARTDAGLSASLDPASGARSSLANRADRAPSSADTTVRSDDLDGAAATGIADTGDTSAAGMAASASEAAALRRGAAAEAARTAERSTQQNAAQTASQTAGQRALDAAARALDPLAGVNGVPAETNAAGGSRAGLLRAQNRSGTDAGGLNTPGGASTSPGALASGVAAADDSARRDIDGAGEAGSLSPAFNSEGRTGAGTRTPAQADLHGGVAAASAQAAASAAVAAAARATSRETGALPRSTEGERGGSAAAAGAGAVPMSGAPAWVGAPAAGNTAPAAASDGRIAASPGSPEFAPQLAAHISTFVRDGMLHAKLELNPGEMGPLTVQIQLDGNAARVHLAAEHAGTRAALEQAMPQLAGSLRENGLTLSGGGVFEQPRQPQAQADAGRSDNRNDNRNSGGSNDGLGDGRRGGTPEAALGGVAGSSAVGGRRRAGVVDLVA